jgi:hypothetical protein
MLEILDAIAFTLSDLMRSCDGTFTLLSSFAWSPMPTKDFAQMLHPLGSYSFQSIFKEGCSFPTKFVELPQIFKFNSRKTYITGNVENMLHLGITSLSDSLVTTKSGNGETMLLDRYRRPRCNGPVFAD